MENFIFFALFQNEPLCASLGGLDSKFMDMWVYAMTELGLSFEAIDTENEDQRVGVFLCVDHQKGVKNLLDEDVDEAELDEKIAKLFHVLHVTHPIIHKAIYDDLRRESYFEGVILSVLTSYGGRGIAGLLAEAVENKARELSRDVVYVCCTSEFTYKAMAKRDYKLIHTLVYDEHKVDGVRVFNVKPPHVGMKLVIRVLEI